MGRFPVWRRKSAFTLVEIMIVVLIIGILLSIAIPNWMKARDEAQTKQCLTNLRHIDSAKDQYAAECRVAGGGNVTWANLVPNYLKQEVKCPQDGAGYTVEPVGTDPACQHAEHVFD